MLCFSVLVGLVAVASYWTQLSVAVPSIWFHVGERAAGTLDSFIASEHPIALQGVLDNIGPMGSNAAGADSGLVIASPSKVDPDCKSLCPHLHDTYVQVRSTVIRSSARERSTEYAKRVAQRQVDISTSSKRYIPRNAARFECRYPSRIPVCLLVLARFLYMDARLSSDIQDAYRHLHCWRCIATTPD